MSKEDLKMILLIPALIFYIFIGLCLLFSAGLVAFKGVETVEEFLFPGGETIWSTRQKNMKEETGHE